MRLTGVAPLPPPTFAVDVDGPPPAADSAEAEEAEEGEVRAAVAGAVGVMQGGGEVRLSWWRLVKQTCCRRECMASSHEIS